MTKCKKVIIITIFIGFVAIGFALGILGSFGILNDKMAFSTITIYGGICTVFTCAELVYSLYKKKGLSDPFSPIAVTIIFIALLVYTIKAWHTFQ